MNIRHVLFSLVLVSMIGPASALAQEGRGEEPRVEMEKYYMVFLRRGPAWTAERTPEAVAAGEGHMANIRRLAALGKLVLAGPFLEEKDDLAGIFVFRVETAEEARALVESDPAVKAGRFRYDVIAWLGPKSLGPIIVPK